MTKAVHWNPKTSTGKVACGVQRRSFSIKQTTELDRTTCQNCRHSLIYRLARARP